MDIFAGNSSRRLVCGFFFTFLLFSWSSAQVFGSLNNSKKVEDYLKKQTNEDGQDVALAIYTINADGTLREDDALTHNTTEPMPLASTTKIVVLAAYAQAVTEGALDPDEEVGVEDWEAYYLPGTDGGAHPAALEALGISADALGFARGEATVALDDIASAMIVQSDNAGTDYLMNRIGDAALARVIQENGLTQQEVPLSFLGSILALDDAGPLPYGELAGAAERYEQRYLTDSAWREARQSAPTPSLNSFEAQAEVFQSNTKGSAEDYARIMAGVVTETFISPEVSQIMRRHLEWPMQFSSNQEAFETFGAKGGSLPGILTEAMYLVPKTGDFAGEPRVAVLFFNRLSEAQFNGLFGSFAHQEVLVNLATSRRASETIRSE